MGTPIPPIPTIPKDHPFVPSIRQLQGEQRRWAEHNFPQQEPVDGLLGMVEEIGELSHAFLKGKQRIRGMEDPAKVREAVVDAIGDTFIYMMSFCNTNQIDLQDCILETWKRVQQRDWQANPSGPPEEG